MAKLEELTELLVAEIRDFEHGIQKLERIQKDRIGLDTTEVKSLMVSHQKFMTKNNLELEEKVQRLQLKMESAKIYPKWAVILFLISLTVNVVLIIFLVWESISK